jgi:hypothetical protein
MRNVDETWQTARSASSGRFGKPSGDSFTPTTAHTDFSLSSSRSACLDRVRVGVEKRLPKLPKSSFLGGRGDLGRTSVLPSLPLAFSIPHVSKNHLMIPPNPLSNVRTGLAPPRRHTCLSLQTQPWALSATPGKLTSNEGRRGQNHAIRVWSFTRAWHQDVTFGLGNHGSF